jgi:HSP20 family molecular chaperone IbpA
VQRWGPVMDLKEEENESVLRADLPSLSEDDVEIEVKDDADDLRGATLTSRKIAMRASTVLVQGQTAARFGPPPQCTNSR